MKKINKVLMLCLILLLSTGCFKRDTLEDIEIITTYYPIEFITTRLYGNHSTVISIYPDDVNTANYLLSDKRISDLSKKELFIYNGLSKDTDLASSFLNKNKKMLIIDSSFGMENTYGIEELWLNPSNLLMMTQNIKNGLDEYITNTYLKKDIEKEYTKLKVELSELDAEFKLTAQNAKSKTIVVNNDILKYLEKYGFNVISLDEKNGPISDKTLAAVKEVYNNKSNNYIFMLEHDTKSELITDIINTYKIEELTFRRIDSIKEEERDNKIDYIEIMKSNIDSIKEEVFQ